MSLHPSFRWLQALAAAATTTTNHILPPNCPRGLPQVSPVSTLMPICLFQSILSLGQRILENNNNKKGKLTPSSVVLWILVFSNLPVTIYFSASSNSCFMHIVQVLQIMASYPKPEIPDRWFLIHGKNWFKAEVLFPMKESVASTMYVCNEIQCM